MQTEKVVKAPLTFWNNELFTISDKKMDLVQESRVVDMSVKGITKKPQKKVLIRVGGGFLTKELAERIKISNIKRKDSVNTTPKNKQ